MKQQWHILGAGAIGSLWACHFVSAGTPVRLILRNQEKLDLFRHNNAILLSNTRYPVTAELADSPELIDQLLITTKSIDTEEAFNSIKSRITPHAKVVVLQNGMGSQQWVQSQLPDAEVAWGSTTDGAWLKAPFNLLHAGHGTTHIGAEDTSYAWVKELSTGFLNIIEDDDIASTLWRKLAINCAINPLTAIHQCRNGELIRNPNYLSTMVTICREVEQVAAAENITLFEGPLIEQACHVAEITADNYSSMLQDIQQGRKTEIDSITGYLCSLAKKHDLPVPINRLHLKKIKKCMRISNKKIKN